MGLKEQRGKREGGAPEEWRVRQCEVRVLML